MQSEFFLDHPMPSIHFPRSLAFQLERFDWKDFVKKKISRIYFIVAEFL